MLVVRMFVVAICAKNEQYLRGFEFALSRFYVYLCTVTF